MVGFMGVDIFFVLSGFIIFYTSNFESFNLAAFLKRRMVRIFPVYWLIIIALIIVHLISPTSGEPNRYNLETIAASFTLYPLYPNARYVLGVAWTLTYEVIFYFVFALTYSISIKCFFYMFLAWSTIILITYFLHIKSSVFAINALVDPIVLNFGFGCILAYFFKMHQTFRYWKWVVAAGTILLIITWLTYYFIVSDDAHFFSALISRVYLFGLPAAILIFGLLYTNGTVPKLLVAIGDASYSLYLIHAAVITLILKILLKIHRVIGLNNFAAMTLTFMLTIAISLMFYKYVERPLLKKLNSLVRQW